jgi:ElaB/YqjD/DUF883 family membrane-anchored ribosome-binding protein
MTEEEAARPSADSAEPSPQQSPEAQAAPELVRLAKVEVETARQLCQEFQREATERLRAIREKSAGDVIDGTLDLVKKHPGLGVIAAAAVGYFLGRLFRR